MVEVKILYELMKILLTPALGTLKSSSTFPHLGKFALELTFDNSDLIESSQISGFNFEILNSVLYQHACVFGKK